MIYKKKLIEVALPLEAINAASAKEKSIRHGHPSTLHLWWARRPLAAARAVIFAQMVDDPSEHPDIFKTQKEQEKERQRLFRIIEELVKWENTTNELVLQKARDEIWQSWRYTCAENADHPLAKALFDRFKLPAFHDPFSGGGALPLEGQRLGLESYASDLNPVAVMINKAMIEVPPKFANKPPVNPESSNNTTHSGSWRGAQGLAEDVRFYAKQIRLEAERRVGHLYPKVNITASMAKGRGDLLPYVGKSVTVIAWLWARTVKSPNPAYAEVDVPLASTFMLSNKTGKEAYIEPMVNEKTYDFVVKIGKPTDTDSAKNGTKLARANFKCLVSGAPISGDYIKTEGKAGRIGARLMAIVADGVRGRIYLSPNSEHEKIAIEIDAPWRPEGDIATRMTGGNCTPYGLTSWGHLFTSRQLVGLTTFSDLVGEFHDRIKSAAITNGLANDGKNLENNGDGATAYADAVCMYLAFAVDKMTDRNSSVCGWDSSRDSIRGVFGRQAIPMMWDYAESNSIGESAGSFENAADQCIRVLNELPASIPGFSQQADAATQSISQCKVISSDPPYYDNIGYADLSDFFYVWMRRSLKSIFPNIFSTLAVPKDEELVATAYRHGGKEKAELFFIEGMTNAMHQLSEQGHPAFPVTIYYAFKQAESDSNDGTTNTGWDTFLAAIIEAGFSISGTWPMRTELSNRMIGSGANALASSIVLVCRKRPVSAATATRREFVSALKAGLPQALAHLQAGNIAPVDLAQAAIGPGMAIYTRYAKVLDSEGKPLSVRAALALINQTLDEALAEQEGDFDADTRWALTWFEQNGFEEGDYGLAEQLSKSKNTAVAGLVEGGILVSKAGKVRLLKPAELPADWDPDTDTRLTVWEMVQQLVRALESGGDGAAAILAGKLGSHAETARELCYRLYTMCERKKRAAEAMSYNGLVQSWPEITRMASEKRPVVKTGTNDMFEEE